MSMAEKKIDDDILRQFQVLSVQSASSIFDTAGVHIIIPPGATTRLNELIQSQLEFQDHYRINYSSV